MKKLSVSRLALTYVGTFLGAGFVSGQELWQFFACFGPVGLLGFVLTAAIFFVINISLLRLVQKTGVEDAGKLLTCGGFRWFETVVRVLQYLFLFGVIVIMVAGAAALIRDLTGVPLIWASAGFSLLVLLTALLGLQGLVATFSVLVPLTTVCAVFLGVWILFHGGFSLQPAAGSVSRLLPNWWIAVLTYAAYNLFGIVSILTPFARLIPDKKTLNRGLLSGSGILILLAWSIIAGLLVRPDTGTAELPMVALAGLVHPAFETAYGILIGFGMFACALGTLVALTAQLELHWTKAKRLSLPLMAAVFVLSLAGFGNLVGLIYPVFGYASIPLFGCLLFNCRKARKVSS